MGLCFHLSQLGLLASHGIESREVLVKPQYPGDFVFHLISLAIAQLAGDFDRHAPVCLLYDQLDYSSGIQPLDPREATSVLVRVEGGEF